MKKINYKTMRNQEIENNFNNLFRGLSKAEQIQENKILFGFRFLSIIDKVLEERSISKYDFATMVEHLPAHLDWFWQGERPISIEFILKTEEALGIKFNISID